MSLSNPPGGRLRRAWRELTRPTSAPVQAGAPDDVDLGEYPPPYPSGWYRVANSADLKPGELQRVQCVGEELVVYRGKSGTVQVVDAHCPHQGADLGVGGKVKGDCLQCPFHHWEFAPDGHVSKIPDLEKLPPIRLRTWPTTEFHGMVWMFRHADGSNGPPAYPLDEHPDIVSGERVYRGEYDAGHVDMHLIEFAENSVDFQHFEPLHGKMLVPWTSIAVPLIKVRHVPTWGLDEEHGHVAYFTDSANLLLFGREIPRANADARITIFGPGSIVWFKFDIPDVGRITMFQTHTPVGPRRQRIYFRWYAEPQVPRALAAYVVGSWISNWRADIHIWENKVYRRKPMLCKIDGPIAKMRKWYGQFYETSGAIKSDAA